MYKLTVLTFALMLLNVNAQCQTLEPAPMEHSKMDHAAHMKMMADAQRQAEVSELGKDVMPFTLSATKHIFSKTAEGGVQQVVARNADDAPQVKLIREHLQQIREQFLKGDFSGPSHIHGDGMPGLVELKASSPGQIAIIYREVKAGAELIYASNHASLVAALHTWFDAQLSDHGKDAEENASLMK